MANPDLEQTQHITAECQRVALAFGLHVDFAQYEMCAALFTEDATFERKGEILRGRTQILAAQQSRPAGLRTRHHCLSPWITVVDADHAEGITYFSTYRHEGQEPLAGPAPMAGPETVGEFHDRFVRTPQGWKIDSRIARAAFRRTA